MPRRVSLPDRRRPVPPHRRAGARPRGPGRAGAGRAGAGGRRTPERPRRAKPSGRVRHDEKMTVYVTSDELLDLEHARLALRRDHGLALDRGRLVREALALVLRRLRGEGPRQRPGATADRGMTDLMDSPAGLDEAAAGDQAQPAFAVRLDNFEGPFDLLLSLIAKHKLDITEVALSRVTDEFIAHVKAMGKAWDLEQTTSFLRGRLHPARPQGRPAAAAG